VCPLNCGFCFTESPDNPIGTKKRLKIEMSLDERLALIDQAAALGARSINIIGAGEPTIDPYFFILLERMQEYGITPIVYTEGTLRLTDQNFVQKLFDLGATVVLKVNTLEDEAYQNAIVAGPAGRKGRVVGNYFQNRAIALQNLIDAGFNKCVPTRLAFDTIMCKENQDEILRIHRFARENNIFVLFVNYLPSGRSTDLMHNALSKDEQMALNQQMADFDLENYGIEHEARFPYGSMPCSIRSFGMYVKIGGKTFDCPGESEFWGDARQEPLAAIWGRHGRNVQAEFDGGCPPREKFWKELQKLNPEIEIPI
jgi:MoaA/NifB/PqqE/SkfB family radical SAM enzyme